MQTAPLHNNSPTSITEVGATGGEAEAEAEDAHTKHEEGGMLPTLEHPAADRNSPSVTYQVNGKKIMTKKNGDTKTIMKDTTTVMNTKTTRGRETIPGEGIEQEPSPVHANLLQSPHFDAVLGRQKTSSEYFSGG